MVTILGVDFEIADIIAIIAAVVSTFFAILNIIFYFKDNRRDKRTLTIQAYQRLADKDGPLHYFYHMPNSQFVLVIRLLLKKQNDKIREENNQFFTKFEDELDMFDEFAAGINAGLYEYNVFDILAYNYCRKRIMPKLKYIEKLYNKDYQYRNLKQLYKLMEKKRDKKREMEEKNEDFENEFNSNAYEKMTITDILSQLHY